MIPIFPSTFEFMNFMVQALLVLIALSAAWMFSRYLRSMLAQNRMAAIRRLAGVAVDYVEHLNLQGELTALTGADREARKRELAAQWLCGELHEHGVQIREPQAQTWIAAEYHQRAGSLPTAEKIAELASDGLDLAHRLEQAHLVEPPAGANPSMFLAGLAADWLAVELAKSGVNLSRDQAIACVHGEIIHRLQTQADQTLMEDPLVLLAREAVEFMENLKASGQMAIRPGVSGDNLATLNNLIIGLCLRQGFTNLAKARRFFRQSLRRRLSSIQRLIMLFCESPVPG